MTRDELKRATGVRRISKLSDHTTVVVMLNGYVRPASPLEIRLWNLLLRGTNESQQ